MTYKYPSLRTTLPIAGYYARLDAGAAASDQFTADGTQDGTLTNGATRANDGGLAYSFDGTNDYITSAQTVPTGATSRTVSFWFKCTGTISTRQWLLWAGTNSAYTRFSIEIESSKINFNYQIAAKVHTTTLSANTWYHVAVVYNGGTSVSIFLNGSKQTFTLASALNTGTGNTVWGIVGVDLVSLPFTGLIDDMLIWNSVALSDTNIGYLASQRGAIHQLLAGSSPINGQSLIRPVGDYRPQQLIMS